MKKVYETPDLRTIGVEVVDCLSASSYEVGDTDPTVDIKDIV